jgi:hypothetical protein
MSDNSYGDLPVCVAVVICDTVIEDKRTNNKSLIGVFNTIVSKQLPVVQPRMYVVVSVTNVLGAAEFRLTLRDPEGASTLSVDLPLESQDPLATHDLLIELLGVPFNHPGPHSFDVSANGHHVGSRRFTISYQP